MQRLLLFLIVSVSLFALVLSGCNGGAETREEPPPEDEEQPVEPADEEEQDEDPANGREEQDEADPRSEDEEHPHEENGHEHEQDHEHEHDAEHHDEETDPGEEPDDGVEETPSEPSAYPSWAETVRHDIGIWLQAVGYGPTVEEAEAAARATLQEQMAAIATSYLETIEIDPDDPFDPDLIDSYGETIASDIIDEAEVEQTEVIENFTFVEVRLDFERLVGQTTSYFGDWFGFMRQAGPPPERSDVAAGMSEAQEEVVRD